MNRKIKHVYRTLINIVFVSKQRDCDGNPNYELRIINPDGPSLTNLTSNEAQDSHPTW